MVRLPNCERASVDPEKVRSYLLSTSHPVGRFKAAWFHARGYSGDAWEDLLAELLRHARDGEASPAGVNEHGRKYAVRAILEGPAGGRAVLISVWIVLDGEEEPRFVTAYPDIR